MTAPATIVRLRVMAPADHSDDELMLLARAGRRDAFDDLVRRHQGFALRVAYKYLGSSAGARDAAQSSFLELYRGLSRYRAEGKFRAYFHRIVVNQCRMAHRRGRRDARLVEQAAPVLGGEDDVVVSRERRRDVERALLQLSDKLRVVIVLRFAGGLSYQEIADALDVPVGTVKSRVFGGLARLRELLS